MRTHHPGKTPETGQPPRAAARTTTPAPRPHPAVHRPAAGSVPASPGPPPPPPAQQETQAQPGPDFSRIPVHTGNTARDPATSPPLLPASPGQPLPAPAQQETQAQPGPDFSRIPVHTGNTARDPATSPPLLPASPGQPLPGPLKQEMETRFGADFSDVRLHTGSAAHAAAALLGARAYTSGRHIVFGDTSTEKRTLAHELTHILQQRQGPLPGTDPGTGPKVSGPGDRLEQEAEATAAQVMAGPAQAPAAGHHRPVSRAAGATIQRLLIAQITSRDGVTVEGLNIVGRPESPYIGTMGDHSTAFAVQVEAIRRRVLGLDRSGADHKPGSLKATEAAQAIQELISEVEKLPGAQLIENLPDKHKNDVKAAREHLRAQCDEFATGNVPGSMGLLKIQKMIGAFLHYRELIPLTTMNVKADSPATAGKAKGEPKHKKVLDKYANKTPEALQEAVRGLLDGKGVALVATQWDEQVLAKLAPGMPPDLSQDKRAELIVRQHVMSIEMAYPGLIEKAWSSEEAATSEKAAIADLLGHVKPLIEERRNENRILLLSKIMKTDERIQRYENELPTAQTNESLNTDTQLRKELEAALVANGGTVPAPSRQNKRRSVPPNRFVAGESSSTGGSSSKKPKVAAGPEEPVGTDIDSEGAVLGDQTMQEAAETEEDAAEAESRKEPLTSQIELDKDGKIDRFESAGRSPSPFPPSMGMGAHTTAWIVHLDVIRGAILGKTVPQAIVNLEKLRENAEATSEEMTKAGFRVDEQHGGKLTDSLRQLTGSLESAKGASPAAQPILLQQAINSLLTYINYIPGATTLAADTGAKDEGRKRNRLRAHEQGTTPLEETKLRANLLGLLDLKEVENEGQRLALLKNHLNLVRDAYPKCWKDSGLDKDSLKKVLKEWQDASQSAKKDEQDYSPGQ